MLRQRNIWSLVGCRSRSFGAFRGDALVLLDRPVEGLLRFVAFGRQDPLTAHPPELLDHADAPERAFPRGADRFAPDASRAALSPLVLPLTVNCRAWA